MEYLSKKPIWQIKYQVTFYGNDLSKVIDGLTAGIDHSGKGKPVCIIMKTEMGAGVDFMSGTHKWHGIAPNDEQLEVALSQLPETLGDYPL